jgi:tetratricopeptide (TPR) repeat protein
MDTFFPHPPAFVETLSPAPTSGGGFFWILAAPKDLIAVPEINDIRKGIDSLSNIWNVTERNTAHEAFAKALAKNPASSAARYNLAITDLYAGNFQDTQSAIINLRQKLEPKQLHELEVVFSLLQGNPRQALKQLNRFSVQTDSLRSLELLALLQTDQYSPAFSKASDWIKANPSSNEALRMFGLTAARYGKLELARLAWNRLLTRSPNDAEVQSAYGALNDYSKGSTESRILLSEAQKSLLPLPQVNWARLAWEARDIQTACAEWELVSKSAAGAHPTVVNNLKSCQPVENEAKN